MTVNLSIPSETRLTARIVIAEHNTSHRVLQGQKPQTPTHPVLIHDSGASVFAIRQGPWKLLFRPDGGEELYNLETHPAEKRNLPPKRPILVKQLTAQAQRAIKTGRTTPGPAQKNDRPIPLRDPTAPLRE